LLSILDEIVEVRIYDGIKRGKVVWEETKGIVFPCSQVPPTPASSGTETFIFYTVYSKH